ncbi:MAG TPA: tail fiber protein [Verrucomicrobiae bacterium]|nr:tail fiber protein [Verrucomicrobiae bacterium]
MASQAYIGEIKMFAGNFAPANWAFCDGRLIPISQNTALFSLLGTTYGGDGQNTFALPDLRGRVPMHQGTGFVIGQLSGSETVTLVSNQLPAHNHAAVASLAGTVDTPVNGFPATDPGANVAQFTNAAADANMNAAAVSTVGNSQPHENMQPFLAISYIICLFGIFPARN